MYFYLPVKIYQEENCILNHRKELAALGTKAMLVTGKHSSRLNGSLQDVEEALTLEGIPFIIYDDIEENPSMETVMKAREIGIQEKVDFVVGIGGGSPMDAAKAIAMMICHPDQDADFLYEKDSDSTALPVAEVPTTCGTGSEATPFTILTVHKERTKSSIPHKIFPALSLLDARYLMSAPKKVLHDTAVDAFGHFVESYINTHATDYSQMCVAQGLKLWGRSKDVMLGEREAELADLQNFLNASTMAGMAITHTGTSLPHGLSYYLTYELGTSHGKAVGHFLSGYMREAAEKDRSFLLTTAGFKGIEDFDDFYEAVCGKETLSAELQEIAIHGILSNEDKLKNCPYPVNEAVLQRIVK